MAKKKQKKVDTLLNPVKTTGEIRMVRALAYKSHMLYVLYIKKADMFQFLLEFNGEIRMGYNIIAPRKGETVLSENEIQQAGLLTWIAGEATLDALLGHTVSEEDRRNVERFESGRKLVESKE